MTMNIDLLVTLFLGSIIISVFLFFSFFVFPFREWTEETKRRPRSFISNALFREFWYFIMGPLKRRFLAWDVQPNTITIWGLVFSLLAGVAFAIGHLGIGGWMVIFASTCDVYDGMLARARNISLKSGAFFDSCLDRVGEVAMFYGLMWYFRQDSFWFVMVFLGLSTSQIVSYARARAEGLGFNGAGGFFQRAERMIVMSIGMSASPLVGLVAGESGAMNTVKLSIVILALGSLQTAVARCLGIFFDIRKTET